MNLFTNIKILWMAARLARIFGTEDDKVNWPFYYKTGVWRHGESCTRLHNKPAISQTIIFYHMYDNPPAAVAFADGMEVEEAQLISALHHFEEFFLEIFLEFMKYGEIEQLHVSDNIGEHSLGNVYVRFSNEKAAKKWFEDLSNKYYEGRILRCEYSPVCEFKEAKWRQYSDGACERGGYCNFMHLKYVAKSFLKALFKYMYDTYPQYEDRRRYRNSEDGERRHRDYEMERIDEECVKVQHEESKSAVKDEMEY